MSDDSDVEWEDVGPGEKSEDFLQEHGFASRGYTIPIEIPSSSHVNVTDENGKPFPSIMDRLLFTWTG